MDELIRQIDEAGSTYEKIVITGDVNLCATSWSDVNYARKKLSQPLLECLKQHGLEVQDIGSTYLADHVLKYGSIPESSLDHVYISTAIQKEWGDI